MVTQVTHAQLAAFSTNAYTPEQPNLVTVKDWEMIAFDQGGEDGFGASVFFGPGGEVVIAFRGTDTALSNALLAEHLNGSDTAAYGGDLAYRYNRFGTLSDISFTPAMGILGDSGFGASAQVLRSLANLQDESVRLS